MSFAAKVSFSVLILSVAAASQLVAQTIEPLDRFRRRGEAEQRYNEGRGRERLPDVDLSIDPVPEGEEEEPLFLEKMADWLRVHGGVGFQEKYSNNVFLWPQASPRSDGKPDDFLHTVSPNIRLEMPFQQMPIKVDYTMDIIRAGHFNNFNTEEHHLATVTDLKISPTLSLRFSNQLERLGSEPRSETGPLMNYWSDSLRASAVYRFGNRASIEGGYGHDLSRFDRFEYRASEFDQDTVFLTGYYRLTPRMGGLMEYEHGWVDNKLYMPDNERDRLGAGARWDITSKLSGSAKMGYEWVHFQYLPMDGGIYAHAELVYDYSKKLRFGLYGDRTLRETTLIADNVSYGHAFESTQLSLNTLYKFTREFGIYGGPYLIVDKYPTPPYLMAEFLNSQALDTQARGDTLGGFSIGAQYQPTRSMKFGVTYEYQRNMSNIERPDFDFEESALFLNASLGF